MNDPGLYEWLALRRVTEGGIAKSAGLYLDHGRPVPGHLIEVFDRLVWSGLAVVADGDPIWDVRRIRLGEEGRARYLALCQQQPQPTKRTELEVPGPVFGRDSARRPAEGQSL